MKLILASNNEGKWRELRALLTELPLEIEGWKDALPTETGVTLEDNARQKALFVRGVTGVAAIGDDTGLEVEALGGGPGVQSARYAGPRCDPKENMAKLLKALEGASGTARRAQFRTVLCLAVPGRSVEVCEGCLGGRIAETASGAGGFGYDPIFFVPEVGKTLAEMSDVEKNRYSHRGRAVRALAASLEKWLWET